MRQSQKLAVVKEIQSQKLAVVKESSMIKNILVWKKKVEVEEDVSIFARYRAETAIAANGNEYILSPPQNSPEFENLEGFKIIFFR